MKKPRTIVYRGRKIEFLGPVSKVLVLIDDVTMNYGFTPKYETSLRNAKRAAMREIDRRESKLKYPCTIRYEGQDWTLLAVGSTLGSRTYCHLASTTVFFEQANGRRPAQLADWLDTELVRAAQTQPQEIK